MAESISISKGANKEDKYRELLPQIKALITGESSVIANMANITAALKETFGWWWVGFYIKDGNELVLAPFQGPIACTRIGFGKGVCGTAWKEEKSILVPNVNEFPGHIACSNLTKSEIVIPVFNSKNEFVAVLDIDSENYDTLDEIDVKYLEKLMVEIRHCF